MFKKVSFTIFFLILNQNNAISGDVIKITAPKFQSMPVSTINAHNPSVVSFNKEYIESKPFAMNALATIDGTSSVEYQKNLQDSGGHTGVSINQLPFYHTSIFVDGIYIPESSLDVSQFLSSGGVQSMQVSKGASSSGTNPSSVAGSINVNTLEIKKNSASISSTFGSYGNYNTTALATRKHENSGFMLQLSANGQNAIDENNDKIAESPKLKNSFATLAHQFKNEDIAIKTRLDFSQNQRQGGSIVNNTTNTIGNPFNFLNAGGISVDSYQTPDGTTETWNSGTAGLLEKIDNTRFAVLNSVETKKFIGGGIVSLLKRNNFYSGNQYKADETNVFGTIARKFRFKKLDLKIGGDYQFQRLQSAVSNDSTSLNNPDGYSYFITSHFANASYVGEKVDFELSNRISRHSEFGILPVIRGKSNFHHNKNIVSTISAGNAFSTPSSSFEQNHELITTDLNTLERTITKATQSLNFAYNTAFIYENFQLNLNYNYNKISNIAALELHEDGNDINGEFRTLSGNYKNQGVGFDATIFANDTLLFTIAGERYWNDLSNLESGYLMLARPEYKVSTKATKRYGSSVLSVGGTYFGRSDLQAFYGNIYNLSGGKIGQFSSNYFIFDANFTHEITKKHKVFFGVDNIFNHLQVSQSPQIVVKEHHAGEYHIDNINSWGPVRGRFFYAGFKVEV